MPAASSLVDKSPPSIIEVKAAVHSLKWHKLPGTCDIPAEVIKALHDESLILIRDLLSMIWTERSVPQDFKDGIIVPVYKKGSKQDCANYHGITLLLITGKILMIILRKHLECLYESTIKEEQAGFRSGRGCVDQIFTLPRCLERRLRQPDSASCQDLLDRISEKAEMLGLKIKPAKTKVIYFHLNQQPSMAVYGKPIEVTEFFTYLGSGISSQHTSAKDEFSARVGKASTTFNQLKQRIFK